MKVHTILLAAALALPTASAHRFWIVPSSTVLSGEEPWVCFDAAVSNNLFFPNHHAPELEAFSATGPDGKIVELQNGQVGKYRTTFDLPLATPGTYRVGTVRALLFARWEENGERQSWRGPADRLDEVKDKPGVTLMDNSSRVETFVTAGEPTTPAVLGKGLEIDFTETHPNDLFAGETASFTLLQDGKPASGVEVTVIRGDDRYRNEVGEIQVTTDETGSFQITWPEAGRYWLNTSVEGGTREISGIPASVRSAYTATFEVLPE
ncbi:hypothetical protein HNR46_002976 [Haloferula luteola]|uniref:DUF4198 domain-containing protein n=1 Tax=Haloferula luteola TaxID=595692 RepID=A0A840VDM1_9BACT|nr:DUF4198 domain-containing protein [Haloferula luteola]MBB5352728.1 hypothetical protein [Haloferula luteola]